MKKGGPWQKNFLKALWFFCTVANIVIESARQRFSAPSAQGPRGRGLRIKKQHGSMDGAAKLQGGILPWVW